MHRAIIVAALLLAACESGERVEWVKQGADARQLQVDQGYCQAEARRTNFFDPSRGGFDNPPISRMGQFGEADSYRACMTRLGWRRERVAAQ
jgi:hypothetical protein